MKGYQELVRRLGEIKSQGFVKTHRPGNTGVGKTLEDLLGIEENNIPGPNGTMIEIKSARKNAKSMLTLFTKSPLPPKANAVLLQKLGYPSKRGNNKKELHTTVNAISFNTLKGKIGLKIEIMDERLELLFPRTEPFLSNFNEERNPESGEVVGYWDKETLKNSFETKLPKLLYVKAESRGKGAAEEFWFNEAWLLSGLDFKSFIDLLKDGTILVDIRMGQYPDGRPHDHGTGFRVRPDKLDLCFSNRQRIL
jgi:hypothetical protein